MAMPSPSGTIQVASDAACGNAQSSDLSSAAVTVRLNVSSRVVAIKVRPSASLHCQPVFVCTGVAASVACMAGMTEIDG